MGKLLGWKCDECETWASVIHYADNRYVRVADGAPCISGRLINPCHGVMREVYDNEEERPRSPYGPHREEEIG